ncbi:MAG: hypothetical protein RTU92_10055 [Candidatus Thorarchaeota archaeon]
MGSNAQSVRVALVLITLVVLLSGSATLCSAQDDATTPSIVLASAGELYELNLESKIDDSSYSIIIEFDHDRDVAERLKAQGSYIVSKNLWDATMYHIFTDSVLLCTVKYAGIETVLLGEERARLELTSDGFFIRILQVPVEDPIIEFVIPASFQIVLALCSLIPFFMLTPDTVEELQEVFEAEIRMRGVYGQILSLLLPLLSIGLTFLLLEGLNVLVS